MAGHLPSPEHHVKDTSNWVFFERLFGHEVGWESPALFKIGSYEFHLTKFMILELLAAGLLLAIYIPIARRAQKGGLPRGPWWNAFESLLTFVRNDIAKPNLGDHDADKYVPYLWTIFLFILFCNLLGMIPFLGSPTASIWVTGGLAVTAFVMMHGAAMAKVGPVHYFQQSWPHIDVPYVGWVLSLFIFLIEMLGTVIKSGVLAVRLFANMFAGHMVLATILLFILIAGNLTAETGPKLTALWPVVTVASVAGVVGLSLLELFVAFLQAYIFTFLTALFMGMSLHPQH